MTEDQERATIMVVDDTPANLKLLEQMLHSQGHRVRAFPRGAMALSAAARNPPDIILLDINMPEMGGFEVCERLKADENLRDIPVIFISALTETSDKVKAFRVGGVDYVTKPFQFEEVHARLQAHLEIRRQRRELQTLYDKLREVESLRDALVHMLVHDLRSPLAVVLGNLEFVEGMPMEQDAQECLTDATQSAKVLMRIIDSILDVSKMESSQMKLTPTPVDLRAIIQEEFRRVEPLRAERTLSVSAPDQTPSVLCDESLMRRVVQNLIGNAIKFTDAETGRITAEVVGVDGVVRVTITDNGPGIPAEHHVRVFDKFFQVVAQRQGMIRSTGLGLTFCKLAVEAHGGRIGVESTVGQGSSFWFDLTPDGSALPDRTSLTDPAPARLD